MSTIATIIGVDLARPGNDVHAVAVCHFDEKGRFLIAELHTWARPSALPENTGPTHSQRMSS